MRLHRTASLAAGLAALSVLTSGCLIFNPGTRPAQERSRDVSYGRWHSTTVAADAPGLPDAVQDSFSSPGSKDSRHYMVRKGDTLASIARKFYGDTTRWTSIYDANRRVIADPNALETGVSLRIP